MGWYHSHPHITVHPSAVDLRTQEPVQIENYTGVTVETCLILTLLIFIKIYDIYNYVYDYYKVLVIV